MDGCALKHLITHCVWETVVLSAELRLKAFGSTAAKPSILSRDNPKKKAVSRDDGLAERDDEALYPGTALSRYRRAATDSSYSSQAGGGTCPPARPRCCGSLCCGAREGPRPSVSSGAECTTAKAAFRWQVGSAWCGASHNTRCAAR